MEASQSRHTFKKKLEFGETRDFALKYMIDDDYKTNPKILAEVYEITGITPGIDMCCNVTGSNATAPLYYDAQSDSRFQA